MFFELTHMFIPSEINRFKVSLSVQSRDLPPNEFRQPRFLLQNELGISFFNSQNISYFSTVNKGFIQLMSRVSLFCYSMGYYIAHQHPLSMGFPRQEYWNGLSFPSPGDLPDPGIEPESPTLAGFFTTEPPGKTKQGITRPWGIPVQLSR